MTLDHDTSLEPRDLALMAGGPALFGAVLGLAGQTGSLALGFKRALAMPAILLGVAALMLPALYVTLSLAGRPTALGTLVTDVARSLRSAGLALLGLTPALLFLVATGTHVELPQVLGFCAAALGSVVGLRVLQKRLFADSNASHPLATPAFLVWAAVALGLGVCLVTNALKT